jgi:hypothetical protein
MDQINNDETGKVYEGKDTEKPLSRVEQIKNTKARLIVDWGCDVPPEMIRQLLTRAVEKNTERRM